LDPQSFRDLIRDAFVEHCPGLTDEDVYCNPSLAISFCKEVRRRATAPKLDFTTILRTLTNERKSGRLPKAAERAKATPGGDAIRAATRAAKTPGGRRRKSPTLPGFQPVATFA